MIGFRPFRNARKNLCRATGREQVQFRLTCRRYFGFPAGDRRLGRNLQNIALPDCGVHQNIFNKQRNLRLSFGNRRQRQSILRPRQRHVKQPPFFLRVVIALRQLFLHQLDGKLKQRSAIAHWKGA